MNKKANLLDVQEAVGIFLVLIITGFLIFTIMDNFGDGIQANDSTNITEVTDTFEGYQSQVIPTIDYTILFLAVLLPLVSYFLARKINSDVIGGIFAMILSPIILLGSMIVSNIYGGFVDNSLFSAYISQMVFSPFILENLLIYAIIYLFIVFIGFFSKVET